MRTLFAHARIVTLDTAQLAKRKYDFQLTRDAVLEKQSAALIVCDAVSATTDVHVPVACSRSGTCRIFWPNRVRVSFARTIARPSWVRRRPNRW